jgi:hypothetical protein
MYIDHVGINTNDMEATLQRDSFSLTRAHAREGRNENPPSSPHLPSSCVSR